MGFLTKKARKRGTKKKGAAIDVLQPIDFIWRPQPDLNRCCRRERPVSWTGLDDGDAIEKNHLVGRVGFEPTTLCLKGRYSTD